MKPPLFVDDALELLALPPDVAAWLLDDAFDATDVDDTPDESVSFFDADEIPELIDSPAMLLTDAQSVWSYGVDRLYSKSADDNRPR